MISAFACFETHPLKGRPYHGLSKDIQGYPRISKENHGSSITDHSSSLTNEDPWIYMDIHDQLGIPGNPDIRGTSMNIHGYPWISMDIHAYLRDPMVPLGSQGAACGSGNHPLNGHPCRPRRLGDLAERAGDLLRAAGDLRRSGWPLASMRNFS